MKKGFTLIELLAVIVILAIIATIATPIMLSIIEDTKKSATLRSADFYLDGVEKSIATSTLKNIQIADGAYSIMKDGSVCIGTLNNDECTGTELKVEMNGEMPTEGIIKIKDGKMEKVELTLSNKEVWIDPFTEKLEYKLAPGLYDENDNLLITWDDLTSLDYKSFTYYDYNLEVEVTSSILNVDENGVLTSAYDDSDRPFYVMSYTSEYLVGKLVIDESVTSIGNLRDCINLTSVIIPNSVTSIGYNAFDGCTNLVNIAIPDSVTSIGDSAFYNCTSLKSIIIPDSVTSIKPSTFSGCTSLTSVIIPEVVTNIGASAFSGCTGLTKMIIPNSVIKIECNAFSNCTSLKEITIPSSVTSMEWGVFSDCTSLEKVTIEEGLKYIDDSAFYGCTSLTTITLPNSISLIALFAFSECSSLTSITIPSSVTHIGQNVFDGCTSLTTINYKGTEANWNNISFGQEWDKDTPSSKVINYNYVG